MTEDKPVLGGNLASLFSPFQVVSICMTTDLRATGWKGLAAIGLAYCIYRASGATWFSTSLFPWSGSRSNQCHFSGQSWELTLVGTHKKGAVETSEKYSTLQPGHLLLLPATPQQSFQENSRPHFCKLQMAETSNSMEVFMELLPFARHLTSRLTCLKLERYRARKQPKEAFRRVETVQVSMS